MYQPSLSEQSEIEILDLELKKLHLEEQDKGANVEENVNDSNNNLQHFATVAESGDENTDLLDVFGTHEEDDDHDYAVDKALHIDLILLEIQRNLTPLSDLLHFRQVCKQWHNSIDSTSVIIKQCREMELKFVFRKSIHGYSQVGRQDLTLNKFNKVFKNCSKFPFASFSVDEGSFTSPDAQEFLSLYGQWVTNLRWRIRPSVMRTVLEDEDSGFLRRTTGSFRRLLTIDMPNLVQLTIEGTPRQWGNCSYEEMFPSPARLLELPNLKTIKFGYEAVCTPIIKEVFSAAKNLERIDNAGIEHFEVLMECAPTKVHAIKDFFVGHLFYEFQVQQCQRYARLKPKLEKMAMHYQDTFEDLDSDERTELGTALSKILRSSRETLKKIGLCPLSFLSQFEFPILANVDELYFCDTEAIYHDGEIVDFRMMPEGQQVSKIFPNVTRVKFNMEAFKGTTFCTWSDIFDQHDCLPSCKSLKINGASSQTASWFKNIARMLPNVENLHIVTYDLTEAVPELFQGIWKHFPNVKTLKLQMRVRDYEENYFSVMDSAFTGIRVGQCVRLRTLSSRLPVEEVNVLCTNPSILDLHELETLVMEFDVRFCDYGVVSPIFSIAGPYGFALIKERQNVQIKVSTFFPTSPAKISGLRSALGSVMECVDSFESQIED